MAIDYTEFVKTHFICSCCHEPLPLKDFYKNSSRLSAGTGHLSVCKKCLENLLHEYSIEYGSRIRAMQRLCMAYDIYYNETMFVACDDGTATTLGKYIKRLNIKPYKNRTFDNNIEEGFHFSTQSSIVSVGEKDDKTGDALISPEVKKKWGKGLSADDYEVLEEHYRFLKGANKDLNDNQEIYITELCYTKMFQMQALRSGNTDQFGKMSDNYRKTFAQAGLKTVREVETSEDDCWGVWNQRVEEYTPSEYYKSKELFKDADGIGSYFDRFVLRPLRNLMHGTNDRDYEFSVEGTTDDESDEE